jgi:hypothetical protein
MTLLFPFQPDWSGSYKVTRTFKTDIITSRAGKEQRRAVRNRPRKSLEFTVTEFAARANLFARTLNKQISSTPIYMADYSRQQLTTSSLATGASVVTVDVQQPWMVGPVVLVNGSAMEVRQPGGVSGTTLTFGDTTANAWPVGTSVYPALLGVLGTEIKGSRPADQTITATVTFDVTPTSEPEINPAAASTLFNGREVFLAKPDWGQTLNLNFGHPFETIDFGQGAVTYNQPIGFSHLTQQATWLQMTAAANGLIEDTFIRAKGQRGEFYMPTWVNDLPLLALAASGQPVFSVAGTDVATAYAGDTVFDAVCAVFNDGTFEFGKVSSIAAVGGNSRITLSANLATALDPTTVAMICWMPVWRFASDALTCEWITNQVVQCQLSVVSLEDLPPES